MDEDTRGEGVTFAATGDAIITRPVLSETSRSDRFESVVEWVRDADAAMTNLEVVPIDGPTYATPPRTVSDQYQYLGSFPGVVLPSSPSRLDELLGMGIDLFAAASNHSYDFGRSGMESTMRALDDRGAAYAGLGRDLHEARSPTFSHASGIRIGMVSATASVPPGGEAGPPSSLLPGRPGISPLHVEWTYKVRAEQLDRLQEIATELGIEDVKETWLRREDPEPGRGDEYRFMHMGFETVDTEEKTGIGHSLHEPDRRAVLDQIREADATADLVVMSLHAHQGPGGTRNVPETPPFLESFARECVDAGADVFVGTGPHVLRGIEVYDGKPIFYSVGNFVAQFETIRRLPAQSFEYYGIDDDRYPSAVFDARYYEDGEPAGSLADAAYWQTVVPRCRFDGDGALERIELLPCSLGRRRPRSRRGTPKRAREEAASEIFARLRTLSEPFGTTIDRRDGLGVIEPDA